MFHVRPAAALKMSPEKREEAYSLLYWVFAAQSVATVIRHGTSFLEFYRTLDERFETALAEYDIALDTAGTGEPVEAQTGWGLPGEPEGLRVTQALNSDWQLLQGDRELFTGTLEDANEKALDYLSAELDAFEQRVKDRAQDHERAKKYTDAIQFFRAASRGEELERQRTFEYDVGTVNEFYVGPIDITCIAGGPDVTGHAQPGKITLEFGRITPDIEFFEQKIQTLVNILEHEVVHQLQLLSEDLSQPLGMPQKTFDQTWHSVNTSEEEHAQLDAEFYPSLIFEIRQLLDQTDGSNAAIEAWIAHRTLFTALRHQPAKWEKAVKMLYAEVDALRQTRTASKKLQETLESRGLGKLYDTSTVQEVLALDKGPSEGYVAWLAGLVQGEVDEATLLRATELIKNIDALRPLVFEEDGKKRKHPELPESVDFDFAALEEFANTWREVAGATAAERDAFNRQPFEELAEFEVHSDRVLETYNFDAACLIHGPESEGTSAPWCGGESRVNYDKYDGDGRRRYVVFPDGSTELIELRGQEVPWNPDAVVFSIENGKLHNVNDQENRYPDDEDFDWGLVERAAEVLAADTGIEVDLDEMGQRSEEAEEWGGLNRAHGLANTRQAASERYHGGPTGREDPKQATTRHAQYRLALDCGDLLEPGRSFAIVSAHAHRDAEEDALRTAELEEELSARGYDFMPMDGQWRGPRSPALTDETGRQVTETRPEVSFLVEDAEYADIVDLADDFKQESFIFGHEDGTVAMYYFSGKVVPAGDSRIPYVGQEVADVDEDGLRILFDWSTEFTHEPLDGPMTHTELSSAYDAVNAHDD